MYTRRAQKIWLGLVLTVLALTTLYAWYEPSLTSEARQFARSLWKKASRPPPPPAEETQAARNGPGSTSGKAAPSAQLRKCVQGERVTYTNEPCPAGSREELVQGNLSVMR